MARRSESEAASIGKALSDPTRLSICTQIAKQRELFCGELAACSEFSFATVSHHLRVLSRAGLISSRHGGQFIFYRASKSRINDYRRYLAQFATPGK